MKEVSPPPLYHTYYSKSSPSMFAKASLPSSVLASNTAKAVFACPLSSTGLFVASDEVQPLTRSANTSGLRSRSISRSLSLNTFIFPASVFGTTSIFSPSSLSNDAAKSAKLSLSLLPFVTSEPGTLNFPVEFLVR